MNDFYWFSAGVCGLGQIMKHWLHSWMLFHNPIALGPTKMAWLAADCRNGGNLTISGRRNLFLFYICILIWEFSANCAPTLVNKSCIWCHDTLNIVQVESSGKGREIICFEKQMRGRKRKREKKEFLLVELNFTSLKFTNT